MCSGVMKSGSPPPRSMTSIPSAFSCLARSDTAIVGEGARSQTRLVKKSAAARCVCDDTRSPPRWIRWERRGATAEGEDLVGAAKFYHDELHAPRFPLQALTRSATRLG